MADGAVAATGSSRGRATPGAGGRRSRTGSARAGRAGGAAPAARADSRCAQRARAAATRAPASGSSGPADGAAEPGGDVRRPQEGQRPLAQLFSVLRSAEPFPGQGRGRGGEAGDRPAGGSEPECSQVGAAGALCAPSSSARVSSGPALGGLDPGKFLLPAGGFPAAFGGFWLCPLHSGRRCSCQGRLTPLRVVLCHLKVSRSDS